MTKRTLTTANVDVAPFSLTLPTELSIQPKWVVDLPQGKRAEVYEQNRTVRPTYRGDGVLTEGYTDTYYSIVVVNKNGTIRAGQYYRDAAEVGSLFAVTYRLRQLTDEFTKKSRTTREVYSDDD